MLDTLDRPEIHPDDLDLLCTCLIIQIHHGMLEMILGNGLGYLL